MADHKLNVQYPDLKGSEQHHDLKNEDGENNDPAHNAEAGAWDKLDKDTAKEIKDKLTSED